MTFLHNVSNGGKSKRETSDHSIVGYDSNQQSGSEFKQESGLSNQIVLNRIRNGESISQRCAGSCQNLQRSTDPKTPLIAPTLRTSSPAGIVQRKLFVDDEELTDADDAISVIEARQGETLSDNQKQYLKDIIRSRNIHKYQDYDKLVKQLKMIELMPQAAAETEDVMDFSSNWVVDSTFWDLDPESDDGPQYIAIIKNHYLAVDDLFRPGNASQFECGGLSELKIIRALQLSVNEDEFNELVINKIGDEFLTLPLNEELRAFEDLGAIDSSSNLFSEEIGDSADPEELGENENFKPGDMVIFSLDKDKTDKIEKGDEHENIKEGYKTIWLVENAVCTGYDGDEPLFAGGGISGEFTKEQMKLKLVEEMEDDIYENGTYVSLSPPEDYTQYITLSAYSEKLNVFGEIETPILHYVVKGENLSRIARNWGVSLASLKSANSQVKGPKYIIRQGDVLVIPN